MRGWSAACALCAPAQWGGSGASGGAGHTIDVAVSWRSKKAILAAIMATMVTMMIVVAMLVRGGVLLLLRRVTSLLSCGKETTGKRARGPLHTILSEAYNGLKEL